MVLAVPPFAKPLSKNINLAQTARVGKAELQAGEYRLLIDGNKATVQKGGKVIAEELGLKPGTPVAQGGIDAYLGMLGMGAVGAGPCARS